MSKQFSPIVIGVIQAILVVEAVVGLVTGQPSTSFVALATLDATRTFELELSPAGYLHLKGRELGGLGEVMSEFIRLNRRRVGRKER